MLRNRRIARCFLMLLWMGSALVSAEVAHALTATIEILQPVLSSEGTATHRGASIRVVGETFVPGTRIEDIRVGDESVDLPETRRLVVGQSVRFEREVPLNPGSNAIEVLVTDEKGHSSQKTIVIERLTAAPMLSQPQEQQDGTHVVIETGQAELWDRTKSQAKEAAKAEALRKAAERAAGVYITSQTEVKNFMLESDEIKTFSRAFVKSIREIEYTYDRLTETGTFTGEFVVDVKAMEEYVTTLLETEKEEVGKASEEIQVYFAFYDAEGRRLREGDVVHEDDQYQIMIQTFQPCYLYIINRDASGAVYALFPREEIMTGNPLAPGQEYYFPDGNHMYAFDEVTGLEHFYIVASLSPLDDIDALFERICALGGKASYELAPVVEHRVNQRGGGRIVQQYTGQTVEKTSLQEARITAEILRSTGSLVRQIHLNHRPKP